MNFEQAREAAKKGNKIARSGWNGGNMFVVYMPPLYLPVGEEAPLDSKPYFAMYNQKQWVRGWLASQSEMLADDWKIVD